MPDSLPHILLASPDRELLKRYQAPLRDLPATVELAGTAEAALAVLARRAGADATSLPQPVVAAAVLDPRLATGVDGVPAGKHIDFNRLLAAAPESRGGGPVPVILLSDTVLPQWMDRMRERVLGDVLPLTSSPEYLRLRVGQLLDSYRAAEELEILRTAAAMEQRVDRLTGVMTRAEMLSTLFTETDRVQRMGTSLCMILFDVDDFSHWNGRLGADACDDLLVQITQRVRRLLRSYDLLGRMGADEFLAALPGCGTANAVLLAERIRGAAFSEPFHVQGKAVRLSACFAVGASQGRAPVVVLRELAEALRRAQQAGPETIESAGGCPDAAPVEFLSPTTGEDLLVW